MHAYLEWCRSNYWYADGPATASQVCFQVVFNLNAFTEIDSVLDAVNMPYPGGQTNAAEAIRVVRQTMFTPENGDQTSASNVLVLITDGISQDRYCGSLSYSGIRRTQNILFSTFVAAAFSYYLILTIHS